MTSVSTSRRNGVNGSLAIKAPCVSATTANITLSAEQTVDGVALVAGDRCLVKTQTTGSENGIYKVSSGAWTREPDWDGSRDVVKGTIIHVTGGTTNIGYWEVKTDNPIVVGTTSVTIGQGFRFVNHPTEAGETGVTDTSYPVGDVRRYGATGDGSTDDTAFIQNAYDSALATGEVYFPYGYYRITVPIVISSAPVLVTRGSGRTNNKTSGLKSLVYLDNATTDSSIYRFTDTTYLSAAMTFVDMNFGCSDTGANQSAVVFEGRSSSWSFVRCQFQDFRGYAIGIKPGSTSYSQNCSLRDVSFFDVGGCLGLTVEPSNSDEYLAITLLEISNVNLDRGLNPNGGVNYVWDFRAVREIHATSFLNEGVGNTTVDSVMAFATSSFSFFKNCHTEFTTNPPTYMATFVGDANDKFYEGNSSSVDIQGYNGSAKFNFETAQEAFLRVSDWVNYNAAATTDLVVFDDVLFGTAEFNRVQVKTPWTLLPSDYGRVTLSLAGEDVNVKPLIHQRAALLGKWDANDGVLTNCQWGHFYISEYATSIASSAVEADSSFNVMRYTSNVGYIPTIRFYFDIPSAWADCMVTLKVRYKLDFDAADTALVSQVPGLPSGIGHSINRLIKDTSDYITSVSIWKPSSTGAINFECSVSSGPSVATVLRIASVEAWLGSPEDAQDFLIDRV